MQASLDKSPAKYGLEFQSQVSVVDYVKKAGMDFASFGFSGQTGGEPYPNTGAETFQRYWQ